MLQDGLWIKSAAAMAALRFFFLIMIVNLLFQFNTA